MEIGYRGEEAVGSDIATGLGGLGVEPVEDTDGHPVVVGATTDSSLFSTVNQQADSPWIAVEIGGVGGTPLEGVSGAVSVLNPDGPCFTCLTQRITASGAPSGDTPGETSSAVAHFAGAVAGRLLQKDGITGLAEQVGLVHLLDGGDARLLPVPACTCDPGSDRFDQPSLGEEAPPGDALERAERAVDPRIGLISQVGEQSSYPVPYYVAEVADTSVMSDVQAARYAGGVDLDWNDAFMRAIGEGLERYSAGMYRLDALPASTPGEDIPLASIPTSHEQPEQIDRRWPGIDLHDGEPISLPVEAVTFPPPDGADIDAITTGLGLGETWTDAVLAGVTEVIERDACMLAWYSTFEPLRLSVKHEPYRTLVRRLAGEGLSSTSLVMTQDIDIPVVTSIVHRRDSNGEPILEVPYTEDDAWPAFAVGSAAGLDPNIAAERALSEATQNWVELREMGPDRAQSEGNIAEFASFPRQARSLLASGPTVEAGDIGPTIEDGSQAALEHVLDELEQAEMSIYAARTTTRDLEMLGFEACRVLVPDAQPLVQDRRHFTDRLRETPRTLGFQPRLDRGEHPYP